MFGFYIAAYALHLEHLTLLCFCRICYLANALHLCLHFFAFRRPFFIYSETVLIAIRDLSCSVVTDYPVASVTSKSETMERSFNWIEGEEKKWHKTKVTIGKSNLDTRQWQIENNEGRSGNENKRNTQFEKKVNYLYMAFQRKQTETKEKTESFLVEETLFSIPCLILHTLYFMLYQFGAKRKILSFIRLNKFMKRQNKGQAYRDWFLK